MGLTNAEEIGLTNAEEIGLTNAVASVSTTHCELWICLRTWGGEGWVFWLAVLLQNIMIQQQT